MSMPPADWNLYPAVLQRYEDMKRGQMPAPAPPPPWTRAMEDLMRAQDVSMYDMNYDRPKSIEKIAEELRSAAEWHAAMMKVVDYVTAQMSLDMFKDDPKAKALYERILRYGVTHVLKKEKDAK